MRRTERLSGEEQVSARARVMITWSWTTVALRGRSQALDLLGQVRALTDSPRLLALTHVQEAVVHVSVSDWREALAALDQVGAAFDLLTPREQAAALLNGGLSHLSLLELAPARAELERALALTLEHDLPEQEFKARHNLGCLEFYAGHLPEAIRLMRSADEVDAPVARARAKRDLAQVLLEAGLLDQARETLREALGEARAERLSLEEADIRLDLASCAMVDADAPRARHELDAAIRIYRSRGATGRQRSTALLRAAVDVGTGKVPRGLDALLAPWLARPRPVTPDERLAARVRVEAHLLRGDTNGATYAAQRLRGRPRQGLAGDMHDRLLFAKVAAAQGDSNRARREVRTALRRLTERQAPTQSLEVRAALALHGRRLSEFDLGDALAGGSARRVFDSVERWRAISHRLPPVAASVDPAAADLMAELRQARRTLGATPAPEVAPHLRARVAQLEWQIAQRDWAASEVGTGAVAGSAVTLGRARDALATRDETALVFFTHGADHHVLQADASGATVRRVGSVATTAALTERLARDLRAHAFAATNPVMEQALARAVDASLVALDRVLFAGVALRSGRGVVVVPGHALAGVPWGALPTLVGRPVTVATSMTHWVTPASGWPATPLVPGATADSGPAPRLSVAALAGPGLRRAVDETDQVAGVWRARTTADSDGGADSAALKHALDSDTVVHVAAHGTHERQNPYFSSLHLADGPVFAHELPRPVVSTHVVLSACDVGQSDLRPGDEPLGLTAALLSLGVRSVVAAVAPVPDAVAEVAMVDYHRQLADGTPASVALAQTVVRHPGARAFCLYGSDWRVERPQIQRAGSLNIAS
jgi:tetratricopeptide (TPR) repeat protein